MTRIIILTAAAILIISIYYCFAAEVNEPNDANSVLSETAENFPVSRTRPRFDIVTMADFYLRDGNAVSGRMLSEDGTQVVIEEPLDSTMVTRSYSKREVDTRTLRKRTIPEWNYYSQLGEYFAARTWDFKDDPDDFIEAIRCYEKAKQSLQPGGGDEERISVIDRAIKKLQLDREVWTREVESRAKLMKLEYDAEAENRLKQLEKQAAESGIKLNESIKYLDKTTQDIKNDYQEVGKKVSELNRDLVRQIDDLRKQVQNNSVAINDIWYGCCARPRPGPRSDGG